MKKKKVLKPWVIISFMLVCLAGVIYYSYKVITWNIHVKDNNRLIEEIGSNITINPTDEGDETVKVDFKSLKKKNKDTVCYIKVNNTKIDYVVVKGKDNKYYLNHNFNKKWNVAGWVFADYRNKFNGSDKNIIIYGHNMKNNSMFGTLKKVLNKDWYSNSDNHKILYVDESGEYYYQVFSTYSIKPEDYYISTDFGSDIEFSDFINTLKSRSIYDYKVEVNTSDKILTLSSCIGDGSKRVVLHAKLIEE